MAASCMELTGSRRRARIQSLTLKTGAATCLLFERKPLLMRGLFRSGSHQFIGEPRDVVTEATIADLCPAPSPE